MRLPTFAAAIVSVAAALALAGCGSDGPSVDRDRINAATTAADAMVARFEAADPKGEPPRASDPAVAGDLAKVFDTDYVGSLETLPITEGAALGEWGAASVKVGLAYLLWGTGLTGPEQLAGNDAAAVRVAENTVTYRDELGPYLDFSLLVTEAVARSTALHLTNLSEDDRQQDNVKSGSEQVRAGFAQTIGGMIDLFVTPGLPDDWLAERLPALKSTKETASSFLPPEAWQALAAQAREAAGQTANPEVSAALADFAS